MEENNEVDLDAIAGINRLEEPIEVKHLTLVRAEEHGLTKSKCPKCEHGILLMRRDILTRKLMNTDNCILCGQKFVYTDIPNNRVFLPPPSHDTFKKI